MRPDLPEYLPHSREWWRDWMAHDKDNPSRRGAIKIMADYLDGYDSLQELTEIGYGSCRDFYQCFKEWHDTKRIAYRGYEAWKQWADYAKSELPYYDFRHGTPLDMKDCDISYGRHIFVFTGEAGLRPHLTALLRATRKLMVLVWYSAAPIPGGSYRWLPSEDGRPGRWWSSHCKEVVDEIIEAEGFDLGIVEFDAPEDSSTGDVAYIARRRA